MTWTDRLFNEKAELEIRIEKLDRFLRFNIPHGLSEQQRALMVAQLQAMTDYASILNARLDLVDKTEPRDQIEEIDAGIRLVGGDKSEEPVPFK